MLPRLSSAILEHKQEKIQGMIGNVFSQDSDVSYS
jgi:hypothetical protein